MLALEVIEGPDLGGIFMLPQDEPQLIGRSSEALPLSDPTISRRHAELTPDGEIWYLRDLSSANGTFLNGRLLTERISLRLGDEIGCGATLFKLSEHASASAPMPNDPNYDTSAESIVVTSPHSLDAARNHLRMVHRLTVATAGTIDTAMILRHLVAILVDEFKPDRCVGVLMDEGKNITQTVQASQKELRDGADLFSEGIIMAACNDQQGLRIPVVDQDVRFIHDEGAVKSGVQSALCAPLIAHGKGLGAILLEISSANRRWTDDELELLSTACGHGGLALLTAILARTRLQHERLAAMGETVASISHSVKNMLQGLRSGAGAIDLALGKGDLELAKEGWPILSRNLDRVYALTFNMLAWSRTNIPEIGLVQFEPILQDAVDLIRGTCERREITIEAMVEPELPPVPIDGTAILQVLLNVLHNAVDASPSKTGDVRVAAFIQGAGEFLEINITDNGSGIEPLRRETVFTAFHSTKGQRGTGLGLAVAKKVVLEHRGTIEMLGSDSGGTRCKITLPLNREDDPGDTHSPASH
ncbi:MAG: ATP-binding protein [Planctomycetota bacterium]|nr:ATP-binding protein [Planctomycetota bacterium]